MSKKPSTHPEVVDGTTINEPANDLTALTKTPNQTSPEASIQEIRGKIADLYQLMNSEPPFGDKLLHRAVVAEVSALLLSLYFVTLDPRLIYVHYFCLAALYPTMILLGTTSEKISKAVDPQGLETHQKRIEEVNGLRTQLRIALNEAQKEITTKIPGRTK